MAKKRKKRKRTDKGFYSEIARERTASLTQEERIEIARKANKARNDSMSDSERSIAASHAASIRWKRWRESRGQS